MRAPIHSDETAALAAQTATPFSFAPYGDLVAPGEPVLHNEGRGTRRDLPAQFHHEVEAPRLWVSTTRIVPSAAPIIRLVERHTLSSQLFVPTSGGPLLVVVMPPTADGSPDFSRPEAFVIPPGIGINYHAGIWHAPLIALDQPAELMVVMWLCDGPADCEEVALPSPRAVVLPTGS